jgi:hypothetical protein
MNVWALSEADAVYDSTVANACDPGPVTRAWESYFWCEPYKVHDIENVRCRAPSSLLTLLGLLLF